MKRKGIQRENWISGEAGNTIYAFTSPAMTQTKTVRATKVRADAPVTVDLDGEAADAVSYARDYLIALPRLVREVEDAADDVLGSAG